MSHQLPRGGPSPSTPHLSRDTASDASAPFDSIRTSDAYSIQDARQTLATCGPDNVKKRRHSKPKTGKSLPRSMSTPHLRGSVMSESEIDKKRNKLGYQRISIACAHCRRRKIRCVVADADTQGRCQNCIRLKKECIFYPVDQQGILEDRSQTSSSKAGIGSGSSTVSPSPPELGSGRAFGDRREAGGFPTLPSNAPNTFHHPSSGQEPASQAEYRYQQHPETRLPWQPQGAFGVPASAVAAHPNGQPNQQYWRYNQGGPDGDFAPFPGDSMQPPPLPHNVPSYAYAQTRPDQAWQQHQFPHQPVRSMSYSHIEGGIPNSGTVYPAVYQADPASHFSQRQGPAPVEVNHPSLMVQAPGPHSAPIAQQPHSFMGHQHYIPPHAQHPGNWYHNPQAFGPVDEAHHDPPTNGPPTYLARPHQPG